MFALYPPLLGGRRAAAAHSTVQNSIASICPARECPISHVHCRRGLVQLGFCTCPATMSRYRLFGGSRHGRKLHIRARPGGGRCSAARAKSSLPAPCLNRHRNPSTTFCGTLARPGSLFKWVTTSAIPVHPATTSCATHARIDSIFPAVAGPMPVTLSRAARRALGVMLIKARRMAGAASGFTCSAKPGAGRGSSGNAAKSLPTSRRHMALIPVLVVPRAPTRNVTITVSTVAVFTAASLDQ